MYRYIDNNKSLSIEEKTLENIEFELVNYLVKNKISISTAESITGGLVASKIVNVAGASNIYKEGYITYNDEIKNKVLHVDMSILKKYTAVSKEVCFEMLKKLKKISLADSLIVTTGYAGPGDNAGLVFVGMNYKEEYLIEKLNIKGERNYIRNKAAEIAIYNLMDIVEKKLPIDC